MRGSATKPRSIPMRVNWRWLAPKFGGAMLVSLAIVMLGLNRANPALVERLQAGTGDILTPVVDFVGQPVLSLRAGIGKIVRAGDIFHENETLQEQNRKLIAWQDTALRLEAENAALRAQLHVAPDPGSQQTLVRVIGDPAGGYVQSLMLAAGSDQGIDKGQPAVTAASKTGSANAGALVGRVIQAGRDSARLLLITDVNSRIPVLLEQSHIHAILEGDDSDRPQLLFLPAGASITVGERLVTSGNDRLLPPGIAVGVVVGNDQSGVRVAPLADLGRLDFVTVVKYDGVEPLPAPETVPEKPRSRR